MGEVASAEQLEEERYPPLAGDAVVYRHKAQKACVVADDKNYQEGAHLGWCRGEVMLPLVVRVVDPVVSLVLLGDTQNRVLSKELDLGD